MKLLLDTHSFLWFIEDNPRLSAKAKNLLESDTELLISAASLWEIAIKMSIGKFTLTQYVAVIVNFQRESVPDARVGDVAFVMVINRFVRMNWTASFSLGCF